MTATEPTPERWAYLAGLFAGEGCFAIGEQGGVPTFALKVAMTDEAVLHDLVTTWGGVVQEAGQIGTGRRNRIEYSWRVYDGFRVVELTKGMLPFMVGEKRLQGEAYLRFAEYKLDCWQRRIAERRSSYSDSERLRFYQLAQEARNFAGGGSKGWQDKWITRIHQLEQLAGDQALGN